jgi:hypothetical protein
VGGNTVPSSTPTSPTSTLAPPSVTGTTEEVAWSYTVTGEANNPNLANLQIVITVDQTTEPAAPVNADGSFSTTFTLPPCTSAANATRYCTAVVVSGTQTSAPTDFTIEQTPQPPPTLTH